MDPLSALFANVPIPSEVTGRKVRGIEIPDSLILEHVGPPIADPLDWLRRSRITFIETTLKDNTAGMFCPNHDIGKCCVKINVNHGSIKRARVQHTLWHEIGHAIDFIAEENNELRYVPGSQYSTRHEVLLKQHAALIVAMREAKDDASFIDNGKWDEYANEPVELWAEAVAIACCKPAALTMTPLWPVLTEILAARHISVPITLPAPAAPAVEPMEPRHGVAVEGVDIVSTSTEGEGAGKPFPSFKLRELQELSEGGKFPFTLYNMLCQAGGFTLTGALTCVGCCASNLPRMRWRHPDRYYDSECRGNGEWERMGHISTTDGPHIWLGMLKYDVGFDFPVNGKPGQGWRMAVTYQPDDTYSVWLWAKEYPDADGLFALLDSSSDIYCDMLNECIVRMYDRAIERFNGGVIPSS